MEHFVTVLYDERWCRWKKKKRRKCSLNIAIKLKNVPFALVNFINDFYTFSCGLKFKQVHTNYMHKTFSFHRKQTQFSNFATSLHVENWVFLFPFKLHLTYIMGYFIVRWEMKNYCCHTDKNHEAICHF